MTHERWSLSVPIEEVPLAEHAELARQAEQLGYTDAWSLEVDGTDCFSPLALIGSATQLRLGTAIANVYTRGPATLAMSAAGLAEAAPGRFCLGLGAGSQPIVESWNGGQFRRPLSRVREMVGFLRQVFAGERVVFEGQTFQVQGFRLSRPPSAPIPIHLAALRPAMLSLAGQIADGAILNWLSAGDIKKSVAVVRTAAQNAGRDPDTVEITARVFVCVDPPSAETDTGIRRHINTYLNVPVYKAFHEWLGRAEVLGPMWQAWSSGDRRAAVAAVPQSVIDELILTGSAEDIHAHVRRYMEAGVSTAFLQFQSFAKDPAVKRQRLLQAVRDLAPARS